MLIQRLSPQTGPVASQSGFDRSFFDAVGAASAHASQMGQRDSELNCRAGSAYRAEMVLTRHAFGRLAPCLPPISSHLRLNLQESEQQQ